MKPESHFQTSTHNEGPDAASHCPISSLQLHNLFISPTDLILLFSFVVSNVLHFRDSISLKSSNKYEDMPQRLRTPMLFDGWLIDWVRGYASKTEHSHVIRWLIDWLSTRMCLKVCALPCYSMVDWLIEYEDMPQRLSTPMLFDGWLIDWVRGHASVCALWKSILPGNKPTKLGQLSLSMGIVIILCIEREWRRNLRWFPTKNGKKCKQRSSSQSINQPSNNMGVRRLWDISSYPNEYQ